MGSFSVVGYCRFSLWFLIESQQIKDFDCIHKIIFGFVQFKFTDSEFLNPILEFNLQKDFTLLFFLMSLVVKMII